MSVLERWLPFMFRRKSAEDKPAETNAGAVAMETRHRAQPKPLLPTSPMGRWMQEMFDDPFFREPFGNFGDLDRWFGDFTPRQFTPRLDVTDEDDALKITAELPGLSKDDLSLTLEDRLLTIQGEKRHEEESRERGVYRAERYYGSFRRSIPLPEDVDQDAADAAFDKGVLTIRFPKRTVPAKEGRRIAIKS